MSLSEELEGNTRKCWLMKAEPDPRVVKGKDVKFSVDDFELVGSTPWEGVRNYEARNLMKEMVLGDKILFYHSNCKNPGVAGFAEVSKEAYPDYTAWDSAHPYFDEKSDKARPKWFMVDAKFVSRARHFVPLSLLRYLADLPSANPPEAISYVGEDGINAIKGIVPLPPHECVQRVPERCWCVIQMMAEKGGWDDMSYEKKKATKARGLVNGKRPTIRCRTDSEEFSARQREGAAGDAITDQPREQEPRPTSVKLGRKRKASITPSPNDERHAALRQKSLRSRR